MPLDAAQAVFYVYLISRPDGTPCYVGKGKGNRTRRHFTKGVQKNPHLASIIARAGGMLPVEIIQGSMIEADAFALEKELIARIGRESVGGPLVNLTEGGEGFSGGRHGEETRKKISARHIGNKYNVGKKVAPEAIAKRVAKTTGMKRTPEQRARLSAGQRGNTNTRGYSHTVETREKMSQSALGKVIGPHQREFARQNMLGKPGFFAGKKHTKETLAKMSAARKGKPNPSRRGIGHTDETRAKMSAAKKGRPSGRTEETKQQVREKTLETWRLKREAQCERTAA
jgi:hypothetical protein